MVGRALQRDEGEAANVFVCHVLTVEKLEHRGLIEAVGKVRAEFAAEQRAGVGDHNRRGLDSADHGAKTIARRIVQDAADGVRKEIENVVRAQGERMLRELDIVQREDFEAVKAMAQKAREENAALKARITLLEEAIDDMEAERNGLRPPRPIRQRKLKRGY